MNWIKSLWDKLVKSTSTSPTIVLVEEETQEDDPRPVGQIFEHICRFIHSNTYWFGNIFFDFKLA